MNPVVEITEKLKAETANEIAAWKRLPAVKEDAWWPYIVEIPQILSLLGEIAGTGYKNPHILFAVQYLQNPLDLMPELVHGLEGFREDLYILARTLEESLADSGAASIIEKKWKSGIRVGEYIRLVKERAKEDLPPKIYNMVNKVLEDARLVERLTPSQDDLIPLVGALTGP